MFGNMGGSSLTWILVLLLVMDNGDGCNSCDTLIWLLLLSRFCGLGDCGTSSCGCGCGTTTGTTRSCGC